MLAEVPEAERVSREEMVAIANQRMAAINAAWNTVAAERSL